MKLTYDFLEAVVKRINTNLKTPLCPYYTDEAGNRQPNSGCCFIHRQRNQYWLYQIINNEGGKVLLFGGTISECNMQLQAFIKGIQAAQDRDDYEN